MRNIKSLQSSEFIRATAGVACLAAGGYFAVKNGGGSGVALIVVGVLLLARPLLGLRSRRAVGEKELDIQALTRQAGRRTLVLGVLCVLIAVVGVSGLIKAQVGGRIPFIFLFFPGVVFSYGGFRAMRYEERDPED